MNEHGRTDNYEGGERCRWCADGGWVVVARREPQLSPPEFRKDWKGEPKPGPTLLDEMGPCPYCERGRRLEFGIGVKRNTKGDVTNPAWKRPGGGPWGPEGYWRGASTRDLVPEPAAGVPARTDPEAARRAREMAESIRASAL